MAVTTGPFGPDGVEGPRTRDRYGLFSVAEMDTLPDHAVTGGLQWITGNCGDATGYAVACAPSLGAKSFPNEPSFQVANPFVVYAGRLCGPVGFSDEEQQRLVVQKLKANEQAIVENVFSQQAFGQSPGLANNPAVVTVVIGATDNFVDGIGQLEAAFYANYGPAGVIHAPVRSGEHFAGQHILYADREHPMPGNSAVWRTAIGSAVSIGNYANLSPAGAAAAVGTQWIYMTPPVKIWRSSDSDIIVAPLEGALNRTTNQETWLAERPYVVGFECGVVYAVNVELPTQTTT